MKTLLKVALAVIPFVSLSACTYTYHEDATREKTAIIMRNLIAFSSDTPSDFKISYYEVNDGTSNKLVTKTLRTPCILDMGKAVVKYDSALLKLHVYCGKDEVKEIYKKINLTTLFGKGGAGYFKLENVSDQTIKFAIVGAQKLKTTRDDEREIIDLHPNPIYKGVPLLYLIKPETSPSKELYFETLKEITRDKKGKLISFLPGELKKIALYPDRLGDFSAADLPFNAEKIVSLYENESQHLFLTYLNYSLELEEYANENTKFRELKREDGIELFRVVKSHEVVYNQGAFPLLPLSFSGHIRGKGSNILVKEDW